MMLSFLQIFFPLGGFSFSFLLFLIFKKGKWALGDRKSFKHSCYVTIFMAVLVLACNLGFIRLDLNFSWFNFAFLVGGGLFVGGNIVLNRLWPFTVAFVVSLFMYSIDFYSSYVFSIYVVDFWTIPFVLILIKNCEKDR